MSEETTTTALAKVGTQNLAPQDLGQMMRLAQSVANSGVTPPQFKDPGAAYIAIDLHLRTGFPLLWVMQSIYIVHNLPSWKGSACRALVEHARSPGGRLRYRRVRYDVRFDKAGKTEACRLLADDAESGEVVEGPWVDWAMVRGEEWDQRKGSKWKHLAELMFRYRAASMFLRVHCPDAGMGMYTAEEVEEIETEQPALVPMADARPLDAEVVAGEEPDGDLVKALRDCDDEQQLLALYNDRDREWNQAEKDAYLAVRTEMRKAAKGA